MLRIEQAPAPDPGPGELLIHTGAIGVTLTVVRKVYERELPLPASLGGEIAGEVIANGPDVTGIEPGDLVTGLCFAEDHADAGVLHTAMAGPVPDGATCADVVSPVHAGGRAERPFA